MSVFALAASISPGPVNLVCLSSGSRYPIARGLVFVSGATLGFLLLFVAVGLGLHQLFSLWPWLYELLRWAGAAFLLYLCIALLRASGELSDATDRAPGFGYGALMQWLNPKAWLAAAAGISAYTEGGNMHQLLVFTGLYAPICWLSLSCWVLAGAFFRRWLQQPSRLRWFNRLLAVLLASSGIAIVL